MTVQELASKIGMSHPQLSRLESGTRTWNYAKAEEVAEALGVSLHLLQDESVPLDRLADIAEILGSLSDLPEEQIDAVLSLLRAMQSANN